MLESLILKVALLTGSLFFEIFNKFSLELRKDIPIISESSLNVLPFFHTLFIYVKLYSQY